MSSILTMRVGRERQVVPWRAKLLPAYFRRAEFHVEAMSADSGRRLVVHEFPKKDVDYAEDMGRRARSFSVRGYLIQFMVDTPWPLYQRDYTVARDQLRDALDQGGPGRLQLPTLPPVLVACDRYRMVEEQRAGGYVTFDMQFIEQGEAPGAPAQSDRETLLAMAEAMKQLVVANLGGGTAV